MHMLPRGNAGCGSRQQLGDVGFHGHRLQARLVQQFLLRHPLHVAVRLFLPGLLPQLGIGLDDPHNFKVSGITVGLKFAFRMAVRHANLPDLDAIRGTCGQRLATVAQRAPSERAAVILVECVKKSRRVNGEFIAVSFSYVRL